ncbi:hypothetical protein HK102_012041 [Quaeritorhiza haematococci]|nr:hypothetical protein HK102_012041 [Quaeritorhiza haematococci]
MTEMTLQLHRIMVDLQGQIPGHLRKALIMWISKSQGWNVCAESKIRKGWIKTKLVTSSSPDGKISFQSMNWILNGNKRDKEDKEDKKNEDNADHRDEAFWVHAFWVTDGFGDETLGDNTLGDDTLGDDTLGDDTLGDEDSGRKLHSQQ